MKKAPKLSDVERLEIGILRGKGYSLRSIAAVLGRSPNTIADEVRRNSVRGGYKPASAKLKAYVRRRYARYQGKKIQESLDLRWYIIVRLQAGWNPDEIAGRLKRDHLGYYASKTTIYEWLYSAWGQRYCAYLDSRRYKPKKRRTGAVPGIIPGRVGIAQRPASAADRRQYGHWEGDTVVSGKRTGSRAAVVVLQERGSRYVAARRIPDLRPSSFNAAVQAIQRVHPVMRSLTLDNGLENRHHARLGVPTYFCDPYASWQKGGVENANRMIRRYLPKGMDLALATEKQLEAIMNRINNKPRKILGYKSALETAREKGLVQGGCPD